MENTHLRAVGYVRVSTPSQDEGGASIAAQSAAIEQAVGLRGWVLKETYKDVASGGSTKKRHGLTSALDALADGDVDVLVVSHLDRLSRSLIDFSNIMQKSREEGWAIVALDVDIDTATPSGELVASVVIAVSQWERRVIGQRTKDALAVKAAGGVKLGRPTVIRDEAVGIIVQMRSEGASYRRIARLLTEAGIPTPQRAASWSPSTVKLLWDRHRA